MQKDIPRMAWDIRFRWHKSSIANTSPEFMEREIVGDWKSKLLETGIIPTYCSLELSEAKDGMQIRRFPTGFAVTLLKSIGTSQHKKHYWAMAHWRNILEYW